MKENKLYLISGLFYILLGISMSFVISYKPIAIALTICDCTVGMIFILGGKFKK